MNHKFDITPIETVYNNYRFRSRTEARWAVFFDAMGYEYEYEKEGFDLGAEGRYLPDFFLPNFSGRKLWIEIKGSNRPWPQCLYIDDTFSTPNPLSAITLEHVSMLATGEFTARDGELIFAYIDSLETAPISEWMELGYMVGKYCTGQPPRIIVGVKPGLFADKCAFEKERTLRFLECKAEVVEAESFNALIERFATPLNEAERKCLALHKQSGDCVMMMVGQPNIGHFDTYFFGGGQASKVLGFNPTSMSPDEAERAVRASAIAMQARFEFGETPRF